MKDMLKFKEQMQSDMRFQRNIVIILLAILFFVSGLALVFPANFEMLLNLFILIFLGFMFTLGSFANQRDIVKYDLSE